MFLGGYLGIYGIVLGLYLMISHLSGLLSFGVPYLVPFVRKHPVSRVGDGIWRIPFKKRQYRPVYAKSDQSLRLKHKARRKRQARRRKMKYAENNRISHRQLYRQILLTFLAPFLLCLNGKGGLLGLSGVMGIILAVIFLLLYSFFYLRSTYGYADMIRSFRKAGAVIFGGFFLIYLVMAGAYLLNLIGRIIPVWLIFGISENGCYLFAVLVCAYGMEKGMQKRGRMAEVTGGIFLGAILLLLVLCAGQGKTEYITELFGRNRFL